MIKETHHFDQVALLITHYNRPQSLFRLLQQFADLGVSFGEIIVSDDGSQQKYRHDLALWSKTFNYQLIKAESNKGLGNNINKGQAAVKLPFTLYVQEDFVPKPAFVSNLNSGLESLISDHSLDIVRYYAYFNYPYTKPYLGMFREMRFKWYYLGYMKFYQYSDHPHLRRSTFLEKFGPYKEGVNSDYTEYSMCLSFLRAGGKGIIYEDIQANFDQVNDQKEPSTATFRKDWKNSNNFFIKGLRKVYLLAKTWKYHIDYFTSK